MKWLVIMTDSEDETICEAYGFASEEEADHWAEWAVTVCEISTREFHVTPLSDPKQVSWR